MNGGVVGTVASGGYYVGMCSEVSPTSLGVGIGGVGTTTSRTGTNTNNVLGRATQLNGRGATVGCPNAYENCYCMNVGASSLALAGAVGTNTLSATIPGTTTLPNWKDPDAKTDVPAYQLNTPDCNAPTDASIAAEVKPKLAQTGQIVTVSGDVGKLTSSCLGYERKCRVSKQQAYKVEKGFWKDTYTIQSCPSDYPKVMHKECRGEEGKSECNDWRVARIVIIAAVVAVATTCFILASTAAPGTHSACVKILTQVGHVFGTGTAAGTATTAGTKTAAVSITSVMKGIAVVGGAITTVQRLGNQMGINTATGQSTAANQKPSFSVCSQEYSTQVGASPQCTKGGVVLDWKEADYSCGARSCEAFPDRDVHIKIYNSRGEVAYETATKTDADGHFDYSFTATAAEGEYTVLVTVPGLKGSSGAAASPQPTMTTVTSSGTMPATTTTTSTATGALTASGHFIIGHVTGVPGDAVRPLVPGQG
jgi:hypothetical protein